MFQKTLTGGGGGGGHYNESNYPVQELWRKRGGGAIFEGGVLAGHYGNIIILGVTLIVGANYYLLITPGKKSLDFDKFCIRGQSALNVNKSA